MLAVLGWVMALSAAGSSPGLPNVRQVECFPETENRVALYRSFLGWPSDMGAAFFESNVFAVIDTASNGYRYIGHVSVSLSHGPRCTVDYKGMYKGDSARTDAEELGSAPIVDVIVESHGGSGDGFNHYLLRSVKDGLHEVQAPDFSHTNMGGFYIGDLGKGRGLGAVVWDAMWDDGSHYDPHRYKFTFYRWTGSTFGKPEVIETPGKIEPEANVAAKTAGFSFSDQTRQELMPITFLTSLPNTGK